MATPHSLPISTSTPHIITTRPAQLPLPSSNFSASASLRSPARSRSGTVSSFGTRPTSPTSINTRLQIRVPQHLHPSNDNARSSPTSSVFQPSQLLPTGQVYSPASAGSTHAGGIQPSASFFRPTRPNQQLPLSRPSSDISHQIQPTNAPDSDLFQLAPLAKRMSSDSSEGDRNSTGGPESNSEDLHKPYPTTSHPRSPHHPFTPSKRVKQSREALLPIGSTPRTSTSVNTRPSITRDRSATGSMSKHKPRPILPTGLRSSLERVFRRGVSYESSRRSLSSPGHTTQPSSGRPTFDGKMPTDEEQGGYHSPSFQLNHSTVVSQVGHSPSANGFSFSPPYHTDPPLSAVPLIDSNTGKPIRNYQLHPSRNKFFFGGRLLTGGDSPWAFIASVLVVLTIAGTWFATTCVWWWKNESPAVAIIGAYMCLITISSMAATATRDPGILPRDIDPDPPYPSVSPEEGGVRAPIPRDLKVRSDIVRVKYCPTCRTYRPPRTSHCKMCDNCVDGCDHHCQWVNNCVGRRNYTSFFVFLTFAALTLYLCIVTSALHIYLMTQKLNINFQDALKRDGGPGSALVFILAFCIVWPVSALLSYHMRLLLLNVTTIEQIRNSAHKALVPGPPPPNPFSHGSWRRNVFAVLCRPAGYSWLDGEGIATEDKREINPGMVGRGA